MKEKNKILRTTLTFIVVLAMQITTVFAQDIQWLVEPQFTDMLEYSEGLAGAQKNDKWGFVDKTGKWVINPQFSQVTNFSEGMALVYDENDKPLGYINKKGTFVLKPSFSDLSNFYEGVALAINDQLYNGCSFIDKTGNLIVPLKTEATGFSWLSNFNEGIACAGKYINPNLDDKMTVGIIDKKGKWIIKDLPYTDLLGFSEGLCIAANNTYDENGEITSSIQGAIDRTGKLVIPQQYSELFGFSEGLCAARIDSNNSSNIGFIDKTNKMVIKPQFASSAYFQEGLAPISTLPFDGISPVVGLIDHTGKYVIQPQFQDAYCPTEGIIVVKQNNLWGVIKAPIK